MGKFIVWFSWIISKWKLYPPSPWNDIEAWYLILCTPQPWKMSSMLHLHNKKNDGECVDCEYFHRQGRALEKKCALIGIFIKTEWSCSRTKRIDCFNSPKMHTRCIESKRIRDLYNQNTHAICLNTINGVGARLRLS